MDDQVVQKVKECAVDYLGVRMDDIVSVSEIFRDDTAQGFEVRILRKRSSYPTTMHCGGERRSSKHFG